MPLPQVLDCPVPADPALRARWLMTAGLTLALPADTGGDYRGAYETLSCVARLLLGTLKLSERSRKSLEGPLDRCRNCRVASQQAWMMRLGFEEILGESAPPALQQIPDPGADSDRLIRVWLKLALDLGAPAFDNGDSHGCYEIYDTTARLLLSCTRGAYEARRLLRQARQRCLSGSDATDRAWILREAFNEILRGRDEPLALIQSYLSRAIELGKPTLESGDERGCAELYTCVARMVVATVTGADKTRDQLRRALADAGKKKHAGDRATFLREEFDAILAE